MKEVMKLSYIMSMCAYGVGITGVWVLLWLITRKRLTASKLSVFRIIASIVAGILIVNAVSYGVSYKQSSQSVNTPVSVDEAAAAFGFEPGSEYPLSIGGDYYSRRIYFDKSAGYFSLYYDSARPLKSVALIYEKGDQSSVLIVQMSQIKFIQVESVDASIKLVLHDETREFDQSYDDVYISDAYSNCGPSLHNLVLQCNQHVTSSNLVIGKQASTADLKQVITRYLDHVEITLRPSQYGLMFE